MKKILLVLLLVGCADVEQEQRRGEVRYEVFKECVEAEKEWREEVWGPEEQKPEEVKVSDEKKTESTEDA